MEKMARASMSEVAMEVVCGQLISEGEWKALQKPRVSVRLTEIVSKGCAAEIASQFYRELAPR